jgi:DNA-binding SARP family transcriptional activator
MTTMFLPDRGANGFSVTLFGECHVSLGDTYLNSVPFGFFRIAAYILLEGRGRPVLRRSLCRLIWSERDPVQANADIRQTLARVRRFQAEHGFRFLEADTTAVWLAKDGDVSCDLASFLDRMQAPEPTASVNLCELYTGELLGSLGSAGAGFEEWLSFQRPSLHDEFVDVVSRAILPDSRLTRQQRDFCARRLLRADPCHEGAYRALMRGAAESGHVSIVRHLFDDCTRKLMDELGVGPDEQTVRLFEALTRGSSNEGVKQTVRSQ